MKRRMTYYSRAGSCSRSYNAEVAEDEGKLPRTRAAKSLGLSVAAFDAGCLVADYTATEWHHVGGYATLVDYYDCEALAEMPEFWEGAAAAYKSAARRAMVKARAADYTHRAALQAANERTAELISFRRRLHNQWTSPVRVERYDSGKNWLVFVRRAFEAAKCGYGPNDALPSIARGDMAGLAAKITARQERLATPPAMTPERWAKRVRKALAEAGHSYPRHNKIPQVPMGDEAALAVMIEKKRAGRTH